MKLTRYNPVLGTPAFGRFNGFDQWLRQPAMSSLFDLGSFFGTPVSAQLATDVYEDAENFYARFEVPGVKKEDVKLELANGSLTVAVERREKSESGERSQSLSRSLSVPDSVAADKVAAKLADGVLTVTLPKQANRKPRAIEIA